MSESIIPLLSTTSASSSNNQRTTSSRTVVLSIVAVLGLTAVALTHPRVVSSFFSSEEDNELSIHDVRRVDKLMDQFEALKEKANPVPFERPIPNVAGLDPIYFNNTGAFTSLANSYLSNNAYANDFFMMLQGNDVQINQAYCSVASTIAVLNSFKNRVNLPVDAVYSPYQYATQPDMFNRCTSKNVIVNRKRFNGLLKPPGGLVLDQIVGLIDCNLRDAGVPYSVEALHVDPTSVSKEMVVTKVKRALLDPNMRVIINYKRSEVHQAGGGHFSPIGAYSEELDAFLVMDVAKYKYSDAWIPSDLFYNSLSGQDSCGSWNYPRAQLDLPRNASYTDTGDELWNEYNRILGCAPAYRGIIFVTIDADEEETKKD